MKTAAARKSKAPVTGRAGDAAVGSLTQRFFPVVGIGASAGGLEACSALLRRLPLDTGMAFVFVQHLDPEHDSALPQLLGRATALPVHEVTNNLRVEPNHVYVIPPNTTLRIASGVLTLSPRQKTRTPPRSIDGFLESLAGDQRERAIGVILSGTANDGTLGLEAIKSEGGITFAQDESARYDSMPKSAIAAGYVDFVLSPEGMADELARLAKHPAVKGTSAESDRESAAPRDGGGRRPSRSDSKGDDEGFRRILLLLGRHSGVDFSLYKSSTIRRRMIRRMVLDKHDSLDRYARVLRGNAKELDALYSDTLISVTSFFRNPEAFELLQRLVMPQLLKQQGDEPIRVWVLGCSTGQEAYSIAMAFIEAADKARRTRKLQVFATDLNDALLNKARHGLYARSVAQDLSPERLKRFFVEEEGGYRVNKAVREMVVFARQNVISDPPFSRLDLISCRNVLIYFDPVLQERILPVFHYALKPGGFLSLGASESIGTFTDLFEAVDKKQRIYRKKSAPTPAFEMPRRGEREDAPRRALTAATPARVPVDADGVAQGIRAESEAQREADRLAVHRFAPPGVLISGDLQILQFRGATSAFLAPAAGKASFEVLKMARPGLMLPLRAAINRANKDNKPARKENVQIESDDGTLTVNVEVIPLKNLKERSFLVLFESASATSARRPLRRAEPRAKRPPRGSPSRRIAELEAELEETRDYLRSLQEQYEAATEERQAANEELITINEEMANRNADLNLLNNDLKRSQRAIADARDYADAIVRTARDPLIILNADLRVNTANDAFYRTFGVTPSEAEGRLVYELGNRQWNIPSLSELLDDILTHKSTFDDFVVTHEFEKLGRRTMLLNARRLSGGDEQPGRILLGIQDVTDHHQVAEALRASEERYRALFDLGPVAVYVCDGSGVIEAFNRRAAELWGREPALGDTEERFCGSHKLFRLDGSFMPYELCPMAEVLDGKIAVARDQEVLIERPDGSRVTVVVNIQPLKNKSGEITGAINCFYDITERKQAEEAISESDRRKSEFLAMLAHELRNPLAPIVASIEILRRATKFEGVAVDHSLDVLQRQVGQMVRLVNDLLDAGRISRGKIELQRERVELSSVVYHAVEAIRPVADSRDQELTVTLPAAPMYLDADPTRLAQIIGNLLNNACKFTGRSGHIWLTVEHERSDRTKRAHARPPATVAIRVRDTGIGIPAGQLQRVFEMFTQVDASLERSLMGLGIGLTLVKTLVELHGGTVEVTSGGVGLGTEFVVRLPVMVGAEQPVAPAPTAMPVAQTPLRILIVDDNRDSADMLATILGFGGHETHVVNDGLAAVDEAARLQPDAILLDIGLPTLNGYEVARRIRKQQRGKRPLLIALTGWDQDDDRRRSKEAGFDAHLVKPVNEVALGAVLSEFGAGL